MLTSVHSPFDPRIFHKEARSLAEAGYDVTVIAPHSHDEEKDGIRVRALPKPRNRFERVLLTTWRVWRAALAERADIYHFHDPELLLAGLALKILGYKVIYDVHEDLPKTIENKHYIPRFARSLISAVTNLFEKSASYLFDAVVPATDSIAERFAHCRTVATVRNFPRLSGFEVVQQPALEGGPVKCVYVGGLFETRGISQIVEAVSLLEGVLDVSLILCGEFYPSSYEAEIRRLRGFAKADYRGHIDAASVPQLLAEMDIGLVCIQPVEQYLTSLPTKLFEYMAAGLPVIASNFPLWKQILETSHCGLCVDPCNPREIADAIRFLSDNPKVCQEMGANGRVSAKEKFNWECQSRILLRTYGKVLGRPSHESLNEYGAYPRRLD